MNPNLTTSYLALQADRSRLPVEAGRGWQAVEAAVGGPGRLATIDVRQKLGAMLILAGEHLQRRSCAVSLETISR